MKRIICLLVVMALTFAFLMSSAFAAEDPRIIVSSVEAVGGDEIKLTVSLVDNPGITNGKISVTYDEAGLEFVRLDTASPDTFANGITAMNNGAVMNFVAVQDITADLEFFYIYLKVKDGAAGDYRVGLTIHLMKNNAEDDVVFTVVEGVVSVNSQAGDPPTTGPADNPTTNPGDVPTTNPGDTPTTVPGDVPTTAPGDEPTTAPGDMPTTAPGGEQSQQEQPPSRMGAVLIVAAVVLVGGVIAAVLIARKKRKF